MMRLGLSTMSSIHSLQAAFASSRATHSPATEGKRSTSRSIKSKSSKVAQDAISDYANIFTKSGKKIFIHAFIPSGKPPEKRMAFVKLHMYANQLIGNSNILLSNLTKLCNKEGYKSTTQKRNKTSKVQSGNFKSSFTSKNNKNLFQLSGDEDGRILVSLTDKGIHHVQSLADRLNSIDPEEPQGRLKEVIIIFKEGVYLKDNMPVSIKTLGKACAEHGYDVQTSNLRHLLSAHFSKQLFVFDKENDTVKFSPVGLEVAQRIQKGVESIKPLKKRLDNDTDRN